MRMKQFTILASTAAALLLAVGCVNNKPNERPEYIPLDGTLAATGAAPLSAMVYPGQAYYVMDESRHALLFSSRVPSSNGGPVIVKVDRERKAVIVTPTRERDPELLLLENLNPNERYSIWLSGGPDSQNGSPSWSATTQRAGS